MAHKREEYASKLRKQKVDEKLREKRAKLMQADGPVPAKKEALEDRLRKFDPDLVSSSVDMVPFRIDISDRK